MAFSPDPKKPKNVTPKNGDQSHQDEGQRFELAWRPLEGLDCQIAMASDKEPTPQRKEKPKLFVIMPFSVRKEHQDKYPTDPNHWNEVYKHFIKKAADKAGFDCERDDDDQRSRFIAEDIWRKIEAADVILCDLSSDNPNVNLEMGWALRADKKFVLIKDNVTSINFDLNQAFTLTYRSKLHPSQLEEDIEKLSGILNATHQDSERSYSMVKKLSIQLQAVEAAEGNVEVTMMQEVLKEIRSLRSEPRYKKEVELDPISKMPREVLNSMWLSEKTPTRIFITAESNLVFLSQPTSEEKVQHITEAKIISQNALEKREFSFEIPNLEGITRGTFFFNEDYSEADVTFGPDGFVTHTYLNVARGELSDFLEY